MILIIHSIISEIIKKVKSIICQDAQNMEVIFSNYLAHLS